MRVALCLISVNKLRCVIVSVEMRYCAGGMVDGCVNEK